MFIVLSSFTCNGTLDAKVGVDCKLNNKILVQGFHFIEFWWICTLNCSLRCMSRESILLDLHISNNLRYWTSVNFKLWNSFDDFFSCKWFILDQIVLCMWRHLYVHLQSEGIFCSTSFFIITSVSFIIYLLKHMEVIK